MIPQIIGIIKGSTILKHPTVIINNKPIRIVASSDLWRKTLSLADRLKSFMMRHFFIMIGGIKTGVAKV